MANVKDFLLVLEIVVQAALGHSKGLGDVVDAGRVVAVLTKRGRGAPKDLNPPLDAPVRSWRHGATDYHTSAAEPVDVVDADGRGRYSVGRREIEQSFKAVASGQAAPGLDSGGAL